MFVEQCSPQLSKPLQGVLRNHELIWIGAAFVINGYSFSAPDQAGSRLPEAFPPAQSEFSRIPIGGSVPAFHGLNGNPIANSQRTAHQGLSQGRSLAGDDLTITRNCASEGSNMLLEVIKILQARHADSRLCCHARTPRFGSPSTANAPRSAKTIKTIHPFT